ncbi:acetate/propionate family kinase [Pelagovum pacificum]|uniref:Acetate kinase n=1 Tax=Pelagovum pacificum TaxID=2588711 RepID=A0A5C5GHP2_9RHOB|nr:acetate/propionate family kinase [Pelagovum pacificum]QQA43413.1 acetate/propionate family kinase [Pelagovum pacificum]TNY33449.1 acetate/propionate family kinase [Pelagovum pacificum]
MSLILTLNAGSSSLKFSVYQDDAVLCTGQVERLFGEAALLLDENGLRSTKPLGPVDHAGALAAVIEALEPVLTGRKVSGVGHRIVHGGPDRRDPAELTEETIEELRAYAPFAPLHQPHNLACVVAARRLFPDAVQIGCFDTAFHRSHPWVNDTFALPRALYDEGVRRYGFHGLSYDYVTAHLARTEPELAKSRVVICHLGNGASLCAVRDGQSVGSTMGFSALDGMPMGTRCGQVDPGVLLYLMVQKGMSPREIEDLLYRESGLKGLSGISGDMRTLLESDAPEAAEAIEYYVFRLSREIGAMAAVLGGIDGLVFTGGIGQNAAPIRARACTRLGFLGIRLDEGANLSGLTDIGAGEVRVLRLATDEESVIAGAVRARLEA